MRQRTLEELRDELQTQLIFLASSAEAFDAGRLEEAKRLSIALRILLHEKKRARALLRQLDMLDRDFADTSGIDCVGNIMPFLGLVTVMVGGEPGYVARLGPAIRYCSFDSWWSAVVIRDIEGRSISRQGLVLSIADQDGGAHVDSELSPDYFAISRENSVGVRYQFGAFDAGSMSAMSGLHWHTIRQIAHEVLLTLVPDYSWKAPPPKQTPSAVRGPARVAFKLPTNPQSLWPEVRGAPRRNDLCPCGSGKRYKHCHGTLQ